MLTVVAVVSAVPVLLAGAAVSTAAVGAVLGVLATKPAARFPEVVREVLIATAVAAVRGAGRGRLRRPGLAGAVRATSRWRSRC